MRFLAAKAIDVLSGDHDGPSSPGLSSLSVKGRRSDPSGFIRKIFLFPPSPKLPRTNAIRPVGLTCSAYRDRVAKHAHAPTLIENNWRRFNRLACMARLLLRLKLWAERQASPGGGQVTFHPIPPRSAARVHALVRRARGLKQMAPRVRYLSLDTRVFQLSLQMPIGWTSAGIKPPATVSAPLFSILLEGNRCSGSGVIVVSKLETAAGTNGIRSHPEPLFIGRRAGNPPGWRSQITICRSLKAGKAATRTVVRFQ